MSEKYIKNADLLFIDKDNIVVGLNIKRDDILGKAFEIYNKKEDGYSKINLGDFYRATQSVIDALCIIIMENARESKDKINNELIHNLVPIRDASNNIKGYETKRLYIDADKIADIIGEHIYIKLQGAMVRKGY